MEDLHEKLKDLKGNNLPFGGIQIILSGNFNQTLPIVIKSHQLAQIWVSIKKSTLWNCFKGIENQFSFTINMRLEQVRDVQEYYRLEQFQTFLMSLGKGNLPVNDDGNINWPEELVASGFQEEENMQDATIEYVYGDINGKVDDIKYMMSNVIICPHNRNVKMINDKVVDMMEATEYRSYSSDTSTDECLELSQEVLNTFEVPGLPTHELCIKEKMPIMLMRNLSKKRKLCNGTSLIVQKLTGSLLYAMNPITKEEVILPRFELESDVKKVGISFKRRQFPVAPAL